MLKSNTLWLFFLFFLLYFQVFCTSSFQEKTQNYFLEKISERKLDEELNPKGNDNLSFVPLSIYLETGDFNETFPETLSDECRDKIINAMKKAKEIVEDFLEILVDLENSPKFNRTYIKETWGILNYTYDFDSGINLHEANYFVFAKFTDLLTETASIILDEFAQFPIVGIILFDNNMNENKLTSEYLNTLMLHHFIRLLGFNEEINGSDNLFIPYLDYTLTVDQYYNFTNVINYARKYFNCPTIESIELFIDEDNYYQYLDEFNYIGLYWPKRYFLGEIMTKFDYPEEQVLSGFTLAFLDDLPYLHVIKNSPYTGGLMKFGKNKGCEFLEEKCGDSPNFFKNEFYLPTALPSKEKEPSCSSGRLSKTIYKLETLEGDIEDLDPTPEFYKENKSGPKSTNYCPIAQYDPDSSGERYIYTGRCSEINYTEKDTDRHEELGDHSFCVISSLVDIKDDDEDNTSNPDYKSICYEMICSSLSLTIKIGNDYIVCPREGGQIKVRNYKGTLLCPDYNLICTSTKLCNNFFDCFEKKSEEINETFYYDYEEIKTTQNPEVYNVDNPEINYGWELTNNGSCPYLCMQCKSKNDCTRCKPHYKYENNNCIYAIENCKDFEDIESDICKECDSGYILVENSNSERYCEDENNVGLFYLFDSDLNLYKKCEDTIPNCKECNKDTEIKCSLCFEPFKLIDDGTICGDLSTKKYYEDTDGKYKSCIKYDSTCYKCEKNDDSFTCLECVDNYVLFYDNNEQPSCIDKNSVDNTMYTDTADKKIYYSCSKYNNIDKCAECDKKEECNNCITEYTIVNDKKLCLLTSDISNKKYYQDPDNNYYYECSHSLSNCVKCEDKTTCNECIESYVIEEDNKCIPYSLVTDQLYYLDSSTGKYISCSKISNCLKCSSATECILCNTNFYFTENEEHQISCQSIDRNKYFQTNEGGKIIYKKCGNYINNCDECSSENYCTKCANNYGIIEDDHSKCEYLLEEKYYYNTTLGKFRLCSYEMSNCETCSTYDEFICKKCLTNYALKHENNIQCVEKTSLEGNEYFYTNDSGKSYYSCSLFNDVANCDKCLDKETCKECKTPYKMFNINKLCILQTDVDNNIYIYNNEGILTPCSSLIKDCNRCNNTSSCYECQGDTALIENDTCIQKELVENNNNYFKDNVTNKYISCSIINNCITCESSTKCLSCKDGFNVENDICTEIISNDDNDDNKLKTGAIIGIVFGCLGFFLLVAGALYFFMAKFFKKNGDVDNIIENNMVEVTEGKRENNQEEDARVPENENENKIEVHTNRRSIHNVKK